MHSVTVACGQFVAAGVTENIQTMADQAAEARGRGAEIIVFSELALTGYLVQPEVVDACLPLDGEAVGRVTELAADVGIAVAFGMPELAGEHRHNTLVAVDATGVIAGVYRKIHLWKTETWAEPGVSVAMFDFGGLRCSGWICYDTRFPEVGRAAAVGSADLCLVSTAWVGPGEQWELALRSRALDNTMFVAGADAVNPDPKLRTYGRSMIVSCTGRVLARATEDTEAVIVATLDPEEQRAQKERVPLLDDRRLETRLTTTTTTGDTGSPQPVARSARRPARWRSG